MIAEDRVRRQIIGFHTDAEQHWVAELDCGHTVHMRHEPPWQNRPWVVTDAGRAGMIGVVLDCKKCAPS